MMNHLVEIDEVMLHEALGCNCGWPISAGPFKTKCGRMAPQICEVPPILRKCHLRPSGWVEAYEAYNLGPESTFSLHYHYPMTLRYIFDYVLGDHFLMPLVKVDGSLDVHIVGVERELWRVREMREYFATQTELRLSERLGKQVTLRLTLIGNDEMQQSLAEHNQALPEHAMLIQGNWHDLLEERRIMNPDVVVGFNAGLGAYMEWRPTIAKLCEHAIPSVFTDYTQYSARIGCYTLRMVQQAYGMHGAVREYTLNPFRQMAYKKLPANQTALTGETVQRNNAYIFGLNIPACVVTEGLLDGENLNRPPPRAEYRFAVGVHVRLQHLASRPELNGEVGKIIAMQGGRYVVEVSQEAPQGSELGEVRSSFAVNASKFVRANALVRFGDLHFRVHSHDESTGDFNIIDDAGDMKIVSHIRFCCGSAVRIFGLQSEAAQKHNGQIGIVKGIDEASGRYIVLLAGLENALKVRGANLTL